MGALWFFKHHPTLFSSGESPTSSELVASVMRPKSSPLTSSTANSTQKSTIQTSNFSCEHKSRVVGYYKGWDGQVISNSQLQKLTHVIFKYVIVMKNGTLGFQNNLEEMKFIDLKNRAKAGKFGVKIMISIDMTGYRSENQTTLINSIFSFLTDHNIDGIDIDWRHPKPEDIQNQVIFIENLRKKLNSKSSIISMTASGTEWKYTFRMRLKQLIENLDFINVFSFDYYNSTGNMTGPPAPLFSGIGEYRGYNVDRTMKYFVCETEKPSKLNIGIPFYGQYWNDVGGALTDDKNDIWKNVSTKGGYIPWRLIKKSRWDLRKASWNRNAMVPFIWNSDKMNFLGFENTKSLEKKMSYAKKKNIGGVFVESIGDDDDDDTLLSLVADNGGCTDEMEEVVNYKCF